MPSAPSRSPRSSPRSSPAALAYWEIPVVAFIEGARRDRLLAAAAGALRAVVPHHHSCRRPSARRRRATQRSGWAGRRSAACSTSLGRAVPFLFDAVSYAASIASLLAMRDAVPAAARARHGGLRAQIGEGFRFLWSRPFLRACAFVFALGNFTLPGVFLVIVVVGRRQGLGGGAIGLLFAAFGAATLVGSLASPLMRRAFSMRAIIWIELVGLAHDRGVPRLAERLRARCRDPAAGRRDPGDELGGRRLPRRGDARPAARARRERCAARSRS